MYYMLSLFAVASSSGISPRYSNIYIMLSFVILKCISMFAIVKDSLTTLQWWAIQVLY